MLWLSLIVALLCCCAVQAFSPSTAGCKELCSSQPVLRQSELQGRSCTAAQAFLRKRLRRERARFSTVMSAGLIDSLNAATVLLADALREVPGLGVPAVPQNTYVPSETVDNFPQIVAGSVSGLLVYLWAAYEFGSVSVCKSFALLERRYSHLTVCAFDSHCRRRTS
jgi:hypothetical protein